jgi:outer membrane receptor for ferrienterochelin and colicin
MKRIFLFIICFSINGFCIEAEKNGSIEGIVLDKSTKQPLFAANIIIPGISSGDATEYDGKFFIKNIPPGVYQLKASMIGYETQIKTQVNVSINQVTKIVFELNPVSIEIGRVEVTASFFETDPEKTVSTKKLTPEEIKSSPGSGEDIFRIIHSLPGVTTGSLANSNVIVRGGAPDENLALLDNIEIYSPLHFGRLDASTGTISIINPDLLESVEFSSGGFPAEFGGKLSSLFELKIKEGNTSSFNTDLNLNMAGFGIYADGPLTDKSTLIFSARRGIFDLITKMMGKEVMPTFWDAAGKINYNLGNSNKISFVGFFYKDNVERDKYEQDSHNKVGREYEHLKFDVYGSAFGINWSYLFSNNGYSLTTASIISNGWNTLAGTNAVQNLNGEDLVEQEISIKNETFYKLNNFVEIKGGLFLKSINSDHYVWLDADTTNTGHIFKADTINYYPPVSFKYGGFFQFTFHPFNRLNFTAGLRYDYFDLSEEKIFSPRFSASCRLTDKIILNAAYSKLSQDPAAYQMELDEQNKNLKSAKADQFVLGVDNFLREDIKLGIEGYYKRLSNIFVDSDSSKIITNNGSGNITGVEVYLQKKMFDNLVGSFSYTYSVSRRKDNDYSPEYDFEYDRTHSFNLIASYKISESWQLGIKYTYCTGTPYTQVTGITLKNGNHYLIEGEKNSERLPAYHELDLRIDKKFFFDNWTLNIYLDIWNLYNQKNIIEYVNEIKSDGTIYRRPIYDYRIMPILGISAQFGV